MYNWEILGNLDQATIILRGGGVYMRFFAPYPSPSSLRDFLALSEGWLVLIHKIYTLFLAQFKLGFQLSYITKGRLTF